MKILHRKNDSWVAVRDEIARDRSLEVMVKELQRKTFTTKLWLSDLDDTHASSPAKHAALHALGTSYYNPRYWWWAIQSAGRILAHNEAPATSSWKEYIDLFLRSPEALDKVKATFTLDKAAATLYPGVASLHTVVLSHVLRCYVTRNIRVIVEP